MSDYDTILIKNADYLVTVDNQRRILKHSSVFIRDNIIEGIFEKNEKSPKANKTIDAKGKIVLPGLINTHHHLFQTLFRGVDKLKKQEIISWIKTMCELCEGLDYDASYISALTGMAELILSGCTTTTDQLYVYPNNQNNVIDATIEAAKDIGIRFQPVRGFIEKMEKSAWSENITQTDSEIMKECKRVIKKYHDDSNNSMIRVSIGPVGIYTATKELLEESIKLARKYKVSFHTHVSESLGTEKYCQDNFGVGEIDFLDSVNCLGKDVWLAHVVYVDSDGVNKLAKTKTGVSYCPGSTGKKKVAPIIEMLEQGVNVSIGVDGSASNDSSNMILDTRMGMFLQSFNQNQPPASYLRATQGLELATIGGAKVLNREKRLGSIEKGKLADIIIYDPRDKIGLAGSNNPLEAIFRCTPHYVDCSIIDGKIIVENGKFISHDLQRIIDKQNDTSKRIIRHAEKKYGKSYDIGWVKAFK